MRISRTSVAVLAVFAAALLVSLAGASVAEAAVYWSNSNGALGRANLDGVEINQSFIPLSAGINSPYGVVVDGTHIYWADSGANTIGRANLDGTGVDKSFIPAPNDPQGVAVDGSYIYWANYNDGTIGRANLNGTGVNQSFISTSFGLEGVAVDSRYIYWTNLGGTTIGRANINGTGANPTFISGANKPDGIAVDSSYIYWANTNGNIGRATLDGSVVNQDFITTQEPCGLAVDSGHVYWTNNSADSIGRANLNGTNANDSFITGASSPCGVAADALPKPGVQTGGASAITQTSAILSGSVNPEGSATTYRFEYGKTTAYGSSAPVPDAAVGSDSTAHALSQMTLGLQAGTTYHYRLVATNGAGSADGGDQTYTTAAASTTTTATAPRLTSVSQSHRRWREGRGLPHIATARPPVGTTFRFTLNESARVRFVFKQRLPGRRVKGRCVASTAKNLSKPKCTRLVTRGSLSFSVGAGAHKLRFQGRLSKRKRLPIGRYSLVLTATSSAGQRATAKLTFTIIK